MTRVLETLSYDSVVLRGRICLKCGNGFDTLEKIILWNLKENGTEEKECGYAIGKKRYTSKKELMGDVEKLSFGVFTNEYVRLVMEEYGKENGKLRKFVEARAGDIWSVCNGYDYVGIIGK